MRPVPAILGILLVAGCVTAPTTERLRSYNDDGVYLFAQGHYPRPPSRPSISP